jgi:predicted kinase
MDNTLYLIRGLPGSGKSTHAKQLLKDNPTLSHYEADMHFYINGVYTFNPSKLHIAHQWCLNSTEKDIKEGKSVIVSNTFTQLWEMEKYIKLVKKYNTHLIVLKTIGDYKSIHNVPEEALIKMRNRWEDLKGEKIAV